MLTARYVIKKIGCVVLLLSLLGSVSGAQETALPTKLQLAVEPEEIVLTNGLPIGADARTMQLILRETSGMQRAELELVARPFTEIHSGNSVDVNIITVNLSQSQATLLPGDLQRVELTLGGFAQAGTYLGGMTIHDTVSGERKEIGIRVSVKDNWQTPVFVVLAAVLIAAGVNHWTKQGRRKNRLDVKLAELQHTLQVAGSKTDPLLLDAERLVQQAREQNQNYQCAQAELVIAAAEQKLRQFEQRQQAAEVLRHNIEEVLESVREVGENDPQQARLSGDLIQLLPKIYAQYEETAAIFKQRELFWDAYRLARRDMQAAREKLFSTVESVKKADRSKIEFFLREIEELLSAAESMSALDEVNVRLRKVAFELSAEKINTNMFRAQRFQSLLEQYQERAKHVTGEQMQRIVAAWYDPARAALTDNRYEDLETTVTQLGRVLTLIEQMKDAEKRMKGKDKKMTELRRILRECKTTLEVAAPDSLMRVEHDVRQVLDILDNRRTDFTPFQAYQPEAPRSDRPDAQAEAFAEPSPDAAAQQLRPLQQEDLVRNLERLLEDAAQYPALQEKTLKWRSYCQKLLEFDEVSAMIEYLRLIQEELTLYGRIRAIRAQAESRQTDAVLRLIEQAEQLLLMDTYEDRSVFHRAEVLADAARSLLEEKQQSKDEFDHLLANLRSPKFATKLVTYGSISTYFVAATLLGVQILYTPNADFGAIVFEDYLSLVLWAFGVEGIRLTATNVYEAYFKKEG